MAKGKTDIGRNWQFLGQFTSRILDIYVLRWDGDVHLSPLNAVWAPSIYFTGERSHTKRNTEYLFIHGNIFSCYTESNRWHWEIKATISTQLIKKGGGLWNVFKSSEKGKKKRVICFTRVVKLLSCLSTHICHMCAFMKMQSEWETAEGVWRHTGHADTPLTLMYETCNDGLIWFKH